MGKISLVPVNLTVQVRACVRENLRQRDQSANPECPWPDGKEISQQAEQENEGRMGGLFLVPAPREEEKRLVNPPCTVG